MSILCDPPRCIRYPGHEGECRGGQYLPDFHLTDFKYPVYVEVKPRHDHEEAIERAMERMEIIWESDPSADLMIVFGDTDCVLRTKQRRWEVDEQGLPGWGVARVAYGS